MSKHLFIESLKKQVKNLNHLIESLHDESRFCFPDCYDCSEPFGEIVNQLQKLRKEMKRAPCFPQKQGFLNIKRIMTCKQSQKQGGEYNA